MVGWCRLVEIQKKKSLNTKAVLLILLATSPIFLIFLYLGRPGNARAGWILSAVVIMAAKVRWDLHDKAWFWPTIVVIALVHAIAIIMVPWTSKWVPAAIIFPFCALDGVAILGILQLLEKLTSSPA